MESKPLAFLALFVAFFLLAVAGDPLLTGAAVEVCGHVVGVRHLERGCVYTLVVEGNVYRVIDFYRPCATRSYGCFVGRPGDGAVYRPFLD